jgi:hypothetical protein
LSLSEALVGGGEGEGCKNDCEYTGEGKRVNNLFATESLKKS